MKNQTNTQSKTRASVFRWPVLLLFVAFIGTNCQSLMKNGLFYDGADAVDAIPVDFFAPVRALVADEEIDCPPALKNNMPVPSEEKPGPKKQDGPLTKTKPSTGETGLTNQQAAINCQKLKSTSS